MPIYRQPFMVVLDSDATADDTPFVLIDLSDTTNFPHIDSASHINLLCLDVNCEKASDGVYELSIGVITEVDATNGTAYWFKRFHIEASGNATDSTDRFVQFIDYTLGGSNPEGLRLQIDTTSGSEKPRYILSNYTEAGNTHWQTDTGLLSPAGAAAGATGKPGVGDVVGYLEEVSGTGTCSMTITALYTTV